MSDDLLGFLMLGLLLIVLAVMVWDGIKTRRIYRRTEEAERIERAERAARNAGVQVRLKVEDEGDGWKRQTSIVDGVGGTDGR